MVSPLDMAMPQKPNDTFNLMLWWMSAMS